MSTAISLQRSEPLQLEHERQVERDWGQLGVGCGGGDVEGVEDVEEHPALFLPYASPVVLHSVSCTLSFLLLFFCPAAVASLCDLLSGCYNIPFEIGSCLVCSPCPQLQTPRLSYARWWEVLPSTHKAWLCLRKTADGHHALEWVNSLYQIATYVFRNETCVEKQW